MVNTYDKMTCKTDRYNSVMDWYDDNELVMRSPTMDGTNTQLDIVNMNDILAKTALTGATGGAQNPIYSGGVFTQFATKRNTFGALPKKPWDIHGYRAVTAASYSSGIGISEGSSMGTAAVSTYVEVAPTPKEIETVSDYTNLLGVYSNIADAVSFDDNRAVEEKNFFKSLNADITQEVDTLAGSNFESIDRVCSNNSEGSDGTIAMTGDDNTIYSLDRDSGATWADANVSHGSGTDRDLSISLINDLRESQEPYWDDEDFPSNKVYITGYDSWTRWSEIESAKQRFDNEYAQITVGEGIQTSPGGDGGYKVATYDGVPIIRDNNIAQDTISRVYLLDFNDLGIAWGRPPAYIESDDPMVVGYQTRGAWYGIGELVCTKFKSQGKVRDLQ